jgi:hypothetical protein
MSGEPRVSEPLPSNGSLFWLHRSGFLPSCHNIVACRLVAKQWLCKQRPFLGNGSVNTFQLLGSIFIIMQQLDYNKRKKGVSTCSVPRSYLEDSWGDLVSSVEFCTGDFEEKTWALEAEESQLLEVVTRERLLKTQQAGKRLSWCCDDLWIVEISGDSVLTCSSDWCVYMWSINPFTKSNPVYSHTPYIWQYVLCHV